MGKKQVRELRPTQFPDRDLLRGYSLNDAARIVEYETTQLPQHPKRILGIDPGKTNIAICYWEVGQTPQTLKVDDLMREAKITFDSVIGHFRYIETILQFFLASRDIDLIVKEGVAHWSSYGVAEAGRIQQMIERLAIDYHVPFFTVNPQTMRRFLKTDEKSTTKLEVYKRWGYEFASEDETDAFAIVQTALAILRGEFFATAKDEKAAKKAAKAKDAA